MSEQKHETKTSLPYDLIPTQSLARRECQAAVNIALGRRVHTGLSDVYQACLPTDPLNCPYVIKIKDLFDDGYLNRFLREQFFAQYVNEEYESRRSMWNVNLAQFSSIGPILYDVWICHEKSKSNPYMTGYMIMDRMEGTLNDLIREFALVLQNEDFTQIHQSLIGLTQVLVELSIFHPNLRLEHIVYRRKSNIQQQSQTGTIIKMPPQTSTFELFIIDWDETEWMSKSRESLQKDYDRILLQLMTQLRRNHTKTVQRAERMQMRAFDPKRMIVPTEPLSTLPEFQEFKSIDAPSTSFRFSSSSPSVIPPPSLQRIREPMPETKIYESERPVVSTSDQPPLKLTRVESPTEYLPAVEARTPPPEGMEHDQEDM